MKKVKDKIQKKYAASPENSLYIQNLCNEIIAFAYDIDGYVQEFNNNADYLNFLISNGNAQKIWEYEEKFVQYYLICARTYLNVAIKSDTARLAAAKFTKSKEDKFDLEPYKDDELFNSLTVNDLIKNEDITQNIAKIGELRKEKLKTLLSIIKRSLRSDYLSLKELDMYKYYLEKNAIAEAAYHEAIGNTTFLEAERKMIGDLYNPYISKVTSPLPLLTLESPENTDDPISI